MNNRQQTSACRVVSIMAAPTATAAQSPSELVRSLGTRAVNLADLADSIRANRNLSLIVTEAACQEFGRHSLSVEDAIVLLGGQRLHALLSNPKLRGRSANRSQRNLHNSSIAPSTKLCLLQALQGELK